MKDSRSVLLLLVSMCLIGTWIYHIYDKSKYAAVQQLPPAKIDSAENTAALGDSVTQLYQSAVVQLEDAKVGQDSLSRQLQDKVNEIDTLRSEINRMLSETSLTREDLKKALAKIQSLQQKINQLYQTNSSATVANTNTAAPPTQQRNTSAKTSATPVSGDVQLQASDIGLQAVRKPAGEATGVEGDNPEQFTVSFQLKNPTNTEGSASVYVVLKDPAGNIVQDDQWMAGMFQSKADGYMKYSRKLSWDYSKGDTRRLNAAIPVNKITKGGYQVQLYQNGLRIGKADWVAN